MSLDSVSSQRAAPIYSDMEWRAGAVDVVMVDGDGTRWAAADPRRGAHAVAV